ncbi:MAG: protein kinase [Deltaproteobacteria bacterium]|nr:protein kinase [Deltaproteobacteria bacterium]
MGEVYRARDASGTEHALKLLNRRAGRISRRRFLREAEISRPLRHPNLLAVDDFGVEDDGTPWMSMEILVGESLAERLSRVGRLEPENVRELALQLARGLGVLHEAHIVHRDLKPANIMLVPGQPETAKILDFGIAHMAWEESEELTRLTKTGAFVGTPAFMAPEQLSDDPVTSAADIYSLGVTLYSALVGRTPWKNKGVQLLTERLRQSEPPEIPPAGGLEEVIRPMLAFHADERPADGRAVVTLIETRSHIRTAGIEGPSESEMASDTRQDVPPSRGLRPVVIAGKPIPSQLASPAIPRENRSRPLAIAPAALDSGPSTAKESPTHRRRSRGALLACLSVAVVLFGVGFSRMNVAKFAAPQVVAESWVLEPPTKAHASPPPARTPTTLTSTPGPEVPSATPPNAAADPRPAVAARVASRSKAPEPAAASSESSGRRAGPAFSEAARQLDKKLSAAGLSELDLPTLAPSEGSRWLAWKASGAEPPVEEVTATLSRLESALQTDGAGRKVLNAKLGRVLTAIRRIPPDSALFEAYQKQYLALLERTSRLEAGARSVQLGTEIGRLESSLSSFER